ncbi:MAG: LPS export ABC transporter periplasmic protein LptC, partial [Phycisphaeraceae bacterium]|nr:LPS export ABC transporter periplasmic protein LptC [Phycisphaeraceae bacterium]
IASQQNSKAPGIPKNRFPEYTIDQFHWVSTQNGVHQWKILAQRAHLYQKENLAHGFTVHAYVYGEGSETTEITGDEAKLGLDSDHLEVFGHVKAIMPDGFQLESDYMSYDGKLKQITVPTSQPAWGAGEEQSGEKIRFTSLGLAYDTKTKILKLPMKVNTWVKSKDAKGPSLIVSDFAIIERNLERATFEMNANRDPAERFVTIDNESLFVKSRHVEVLYGQSQEGARQIDYMTAIEDVFIQERRKDAALDYATGGRATFDTKVNKIVLTEFPQVYQNNDTVTGDKVTIYRNTDEVEVENSNAYTEGKSSPAAETNPEGSESRESIQGPKSR